MNTRSKIKTFAALAFGLLLAGATQAAGMSGSYLYKLILRDDTGFALSGAITADSADEIVTHNYAFEVYDEDMNPIDATVCDAKTAESGYNCVLDVPVGGGEGSAAVGQQLTLVVSDLAFGDVRFMSSTVLPPVGGSFGSAKSTIGIFGADEADVDKGWDSWLSAANLYSSSPIGGPDDDADGDGLTNFEEYQLGTDPTPNSSLDLQRNPEISLVESGKGYQITFNRDARHVYSIRVVDVGTNPEGEDLEMFEGADGGSSCGRFLYDETSWHKTNTVWVAKPQGDNWILGLAVDGRLHGVIREGVSADTTNAYDGTAHTVDTNALVAAYGRAAYAYSVSEDGEYGPVPSAITNAGELIVWCQVNLPYCKSDCGVRFAAKAVVTNRCVTLASGSESFTYDGEAHSNLTVTVGGAGFVDGEGVTTNGFATITDAGTLPNAFSFAFAGGTKAANYAVSCVTGTLEVVAKAYAISYAMDDGTPFGAWAAGYTAPTAFSVTNNATLPVKANVDEANFLFNAWTNAEGVVVFATTDELLADLAVYADVTRLWSVTLPTVAHATCVASTNGVPLAAGKKVVDGATVTFTLTPDADYVLEGPSDYTATATGNGVTVATDETRIRKIVAVEIRPAEHATFAAEVADGGSYVAFDANPTNLIEGMEFRVTAAPMPGYEYVTAPKGWKLADGLVSATFTNGTDDVTVDVPEPTAEPQVVFCRIAGAADPGQLALCSEFAAYLRSVTRTDEEVWIPVDPATGAFDVADIPAGTWQVEVGGVTWYALWENAWHRAKDVPAGEKALTLVPQGAAERSYRYDPRRPAKFPVGCGLGFGNISPMPKPDFRDDVVSFVLPPVTERLDVRGRMTAALTQMEVTKNFEKGRLIIAAPLDRKVILDGAGKFRLFFVGASNRVDFADLAFENALGTPYGTAEKSTSGGALKVAGLAVVSNCTFRGCWAGAKKTSVTGTAAGGAVCASGANAEAILKNCTFAHNGAGYGGAVATQDGGKLTAVHCTFHGKHTEIITIDPLVLIYCERRSIVCLLDGKGL